MNKNKNRKEKKGRGRRKVEDGQKEGKKKRREG